MIDLKKIFDRVLSESLVTEDQDSKSQDKARKYVAQKFGLKSSTDKIKLDDNHEYTADDVVKHIRTICFNLKISKFKDSNKQCGKFTLGYVRLFLDNKDLEANGEMCQFLNWCVFQFVEQYEKYDQNINGLGLDEIKDLFYAKYKEYIQNIYDDIRKTDYSKTPSNYTCVKIKKQKDLKKYSVYTSWCITTDASMYEKYTRNGWNQFFVFLQNGFDKLIKPADSDHPNAKDKYGLSMLAVSVTNKGLLNTCTGRWNHDYNGNDSLLNAKELSDVLKIRFTDIADTRDNKDVGKNLIRRIEKARTADELSKIKGFDRIEDSQLATISFNNKELLVVLNDDGTFNVTKDKFGELRWFDDVYGFSDGLVCIRLNDKFGLIDKTGKEVVELKYNSINIFSDGLAYVNLNGKFGFIDKTGKEVIKPKYNAAGSFSDGLARVMLNSKWGFIDKSGKEVIKLKYDYVRDFSDGLATIYLDKKYGYIDKSGKEVIEPKYNYADTFSAGLAFIGLNGKYGIIDKTGKEILEPKYTIDQAKAYMHRISRNFEVGNH